MKVLFVLNTLVYLSFVHGKFIDTSRQALSRQKRWLIWNDGVNWVQFIFGLGIPLEVKNQAITVGTVIKAFYLLPTNSTIYTQPSIDYFRRKRATSRWTLYDMLESYIERNRYGDGKACILKTICELSQAPLDERNGILAEILQAVFTPSSTQEISHNHLDMEYHAAEYLGKSENNCDVLFRECNTNIVQYFTTLLK